MKRLLPLFCIIVILFASAGVASADKPQPDTFTITGYTVIPLPSDPDLLPSGRMKYEFLAQGGAETDADNAMCSAVYGAPCQVVCQGALGQACGVTGFFLGASFKFEERVNASSTGEGNNQGDLTITMPDGGQAVIRFNGKVDQASASVEGNWRVLSSSGSLDGLHAQGKYSGIGALVFAVTFTGDFH
jgi:hypothetical protein